MKLFKIKVEYETVVAAEDGDALDIDQINHLIKYIDDPIASVSAKEIKNKSQLPEGWNDECIPWAIGELGREERCKIIRCWLESS